MEGKTEKGKQGPSPGRGRGRAVAPKDAREVDHPVPAGGQTDEASDNGKKHESVPPSFGGGGKEMDTRSAQCRANDGGKSETHGRGPPKPGAGDEGHAHVGASSGPPPEGSSEDGARVRATRGPAKVARSAKGVEAAPDKPKTRCQTRPKQRPMQASMHPPSAQTDSPSERTEARKTAKRERAHEGAVHARSGPDATEKGQPDRKGDAASACATPGGDKDADLLACTYKDTPPASLKGMSFWAKCVRVVDGDTAHFAFRPSPSGGAIFRYRCRLRGYNTAEMRGKSQEERAKAVAAKDRLSALLMGGGEIGGHGAGRRRGGAGGTTGGKGQGEALEKKEKKKEEEEEEEEEEGEVEVAAAAAVEPFLVQIVCGENDKYGRPLVDVICPEGNVCDIMIREGYAKAYNGRGPKEY